MNESVDEIKSKLPNIVPLISNFFKLGLDNEFNIYTLLATIEGGERSYRYILETDKKGVFKKLIRVNDSELTKTNQREFCITGNGAIYQVWNTKDGMHVSKWD